jgi:hypothetical protein
MRPLTTDEPHPSNASRASIRHSACTIVTAIGSTVVTAIGGTIVTAIGGAIISAIGGIIVTPIGGPIAVAIAIAIAISIAIFIVIAASVAFFIAIFFAFLRYKGWRLEDILLRIRQIFSPKDTFQASSTDYGPGLRGGYRSNGPQ